jgi:hypothetical protein
MDYRDARLPELPASYVERWHREQRGKAGKGGILSGGAAGGLLSRQADSLSDEEKRRRKFQIFWDYWSSPECEALHQARREEREAARRQLEEGAG